MLPKLDKTNHYVIIIRESVLDPSKDKFSSIFRFRLTLEALAEYSDMHVKKIKIYCDYQGFNSSFLKHLPDHIRLNPFLKSHEVNCKFKHSPIYLTDILI